VIGFRRVGTPLILLACIAVAGVSATAATRLELVRHWALYAASNRHQPFHLFLDPFPNERTCLVESRVIEKAGGQAYCASHLSLTFDRVREDRLTWEFLSPSNPWSKICGHWRSNV